MTDDGSRLTALDLAAAERLAALEFTGAERELALGTVAQFGAGFAALREMRLAHEVPVALRFDPRPTEPSGPPAESRAVPRHVDEPVAAGEDDLAFASIAQLAAWLEKGELTSEYLARTSLARLRRFDPLLHCVVTLTEERAREEAARADAERSAGDAAGALHGIAWGAKDLLDTAGIETTWGATPFRGRVSEADATVVSRLSGAGAVLAAKLSLGELAMDDIWFGGQTMNPWKLDQGSSGSSAGSAAAVAAGLLPFTLGSETLGSITSPAARCGAVGLRPTFGRVPRTGAMPLSWSFDKIGPLARSVEDCALVLAAINGPDGKDREAIAAPFSFDANAPATGVRVGYVPSMFEDGEDTVAESGAVHESERDALRLLGERCGDLVELTLPQLPHELVFAMILVDVAAQFETLTLSNEDDTLARQESESWPNFLRAARYFPAVEYVQLQRSRSLMIDAIEALFAQVDVIVTPGIGKELLPLTNATGHPAITIPAGFREDGTPTAVTLHGRLFDEATLCTAGMLFEQARGSWPRPPLAAG